MASQNEPVSHRRRRFWPASVWGPIVLVLMIAVWLGWLVRGARKQREAVAAIQKGGGAVAYNWARTNGEWTMRGEPPSPRWLVSLLGVDYFDNCTAAFIGSPGTASDPAIAHVGRLAGLQELHLFGSTVGDGELAQLRGLTKLRYLILKDTQVTDAGLVNLKKLTNLSRLDLSQTQVTDAGLVNLNALTKLSYLDLRDTKVSNAGLVHLKGITSLSTLHLEGTLVTEAGLKDLKQALPKLTIHN
jgi:hypothetical protein